MEHNKEIALGNGDTIFSIADGKARLGRLLGMSTAGHFLPRTASFFTLCINGQPLTSNDIPLTHHAFSDTTALFEWQDEVLKLRIVSEWQFLQDFGVVTRNDTVTNYGDTDLIINRYFAKFCFPTSNYSVYAQSSRWCNENQGAWTNLDSTGLILANEGGRTTQGHNPFFQFLDTDTERSLSFHLIPCGNWVMKIIPQTEGPWQNITVEMGLSDVNLACTLKKGESLHCPQIIIQKATSAKIESSAPKFHDFLHTNYKTCNARSHAPVIYNTWYDKFGALDIARARRQLAAAKQIGAEVFVVDAGWYGQGQASQASWAEQVGDWRENTESAFKGKMAELSQEVRDMGLGFGLWIEPERYSSSVPIVKQKPDMFIKSGTFYYPDLTKSEMYDYIFAEISRLIKTYQLVWIKFDFNFELHADPYQSELYRYYEKWYQLLSDLRRDFPQVFLEGCASGGGRLDIKSWASFDSYFLSDNVNPLDAIRIHQQLLLRLPPGKIGRWAVLRSVDSDIPSYLPDISVDTCITPAGNGATWEYFHNTSVEFAVRSAMFGALGFSGDIAGLSDEAKQSITKHVSFYKKWRDFIYGAKAHLLTKPSKKKDHSGQIALLLTKDSSDKSLLFACRLDDTRAEYEFCIPQLTPTGIYQLKDFDEPDKYPTRIAGSELMHNGITITNKKRYSCSIVEISKIN